MASIAYTLINAIITAVDFRVGIAGRPDNVILTLKDHEDPAWVPVWDEAEFDITDKLLETTIPEDGLEFKLRHRVNDAGFDDYRLAVDVKAAVKAARKRRMAIETAQAVAASAE